MGVLLQQPQHRTDKFVVKGCGLVEIGDGVRLCHMKKPTWPLFGDNINDIDAEAPPVLSASNLNPVICHACDVVTDAPITKAVVSLVYRQKYVL